MEVGDVYGDDCYINVVNDVCRRIVSTSVFRFGDYKHQTIWSKNHFDCGGYLGKIGIDFEIIGNKIKRIAK